MLNEILHTEQNALTNVLFISNNLEINLCEPLYESLIIQPQCLQWDGSFVTSMFDIQTIMKNKYEENISFSTIR